MVKLKLENDGFKRNKISAFQAFGTPTANTLRSHIEFGLESVNNYEWPDRPVPRPHRNLLLTPVAFGKNKTVFPYIKEMKDAGIIDNVMFDSGGFQVLTGALKEKGISTLDDLQKHNEQLYNEYDWADIYIMPDHPPNRADSYHNGYKTKINNTIEAALKFFECLKPEVQDKVAPVFHLQKDEDIDYMYNAYRPMLDKSKFASYSASALTNPGTPRQLRGDTLIMLNELQKKLTPENIGIHCLGIASPPAVFMLNYMGIRTFDASTPIIGAGLGKAFFPYMGGMSCSIRRDDEDDNMTQEKLDRLKKLTNHRCPFCHELEPMKRATKVEGVPGYLFRRFHNFCVLDDLNWHYSDLDTTLLEKLAPVQFKDFQVVLKNKQHDLF